MNEGEPSMGRGAMSNAIGLIVMSCILFTSLASASDGEEIPIDTLSPSAKELIKHSVEGAELLDARKVAEDGKECYVVALKFKDRIHHYYVAPDGRYIGLKEEAFSILEWLQTLRGSARFFLFPGIVLGAIVRWLVVAVSKKWPSVLSEWFSAWVGAAIIIGIEQLSLATVPRQKDWLVIGARCVVWGAVAASIVEVIGLLVQSVRGCRVACRRWILACCLIAVVSLSLSIPVEKLRIARVNELYKTRALKPIAN